MSNQLLHVLLILISKATQDIVGLKQTIFHSKQVSVKGSFVFSISDQSLLLPTNHQLRVACQVTAQAQELSAFSMEGKKVLGSMYLDISTGVLMCDLCCVPNAPILPSKVAF